MEMHIESTADDIGTAAESASPDCPATTEACHRTAIERVISTMHEHMEEDLDLEEMAAIAHMSPYHFNRTFRRLTGIPPGQFLSAVRLEAAKRLLLTTDMNVTDICYEVGYRSLGTFTTRFTQLVGLSPGQLRTLSAFFQPASAHELLGMLQQAQERPGGPAVTGRLTAPDDVNGLIFLGLFPKAIPQDRPLACAILERPGDYRLVPPEDGSYYIFAAGLTEAEKPLDYLMCGGAIRGVAGAGPLKVEEGKGDVAQDVDLRPPDLLDPPLLVTLPLLVDERLALLVS